MVEIAQVPAGQQCLEFNRAVFNVRFRNGGERPESICANAITFSRGTLSLGYWCAGQKL
jgi:hypothetical protein